jgi:outer membrane protein assembly complex protein YaeT
LLNFLITIFIFTTPIFDIQFTGNESLSNKTLRKQLVSKKGEEFNEVSLVFDSDKLIDYYETQGFVNTTISPHTDSVQKGIIIGFDIDEGERPLIEQIFITGVPNEDNKAIKSLYEIKPGDFFIKINVSHTERAIEAYYMDRGYPYAQVESSLLTDSGIVRLDVNRNGFYYVRNIEIEGLKKTNPKIVRREVDFKKGDIFNKSKLVRSQRRIYSVGFFSTINTELIKQESDSVDLIFTVRELKTRILNFGIGMAIPLSFLISIGVEELNLFNQGHRYQFKPSFKTNIKREWELKLEGRYTVPYLTPLRLTVSDLPFLWFEETEDFTRQTRGNEFRISRLISDNIQTSIANHYKFIHLGPKTSVKFPDSLRDITNSIRLQVMMDYRDEFFNPQKGFYSLSLIEYAGGVFGGVNDFWRLELENRVYIKFLKNILAQRLKVGFIIPRDGVSIYQKYYLGGQYSLRGYAERSIGPDTLADERYGNILLNYNIEYRVGLPWNFGVVGFFDIGYIDNRIDLQNSDYLKAGTGFGLRYYTPIGPARGDIGFPLTDEGWELYLGIYHIF